MKRNLAIVTFLSLVYSSAAFADIDPPWGFPRCPLERHDRQADGRLPQPFAPMPEQYDGIFKLVEQRIAPIAPYFFPVLRHEEHQSWVRITRETDTLSGKPKPKAFAYGSWREYRNYPPLTMRIDKCTGAVSEVYFEHNKVK